MMIELMINTLLPLILCISSGFFLKKYQVIADEFWTSCDKLNYYLLFPALLFLSLSNSPLQFSQFIPLIICISLILTGAFILLYLLKFFVNIPLQRFGVYMQSNIRFNTYIGLAIIASLFQQQGLTIFSIIMALFIPLINIFSILAFLENRQWAIIPILTSLFKNPLILTCIIAICFNGLQVQLWTGVHDFLKLLSLASLPLGLLCIGASLQFKQQHQHDYKIILLNTLSRLLGVPIIAYLLCTQLGIIGLERQIITLFFALPTAPSAYSLTRVFHGDTTLMANIISLQTVVAGITLPSIVLLLMKFN